MFRSICKQANSLKSRYHEKGYTFSHPIQKGIHIAEKEFNKI